jgi:hypothetical protein
MGLFGTAHFFLALKYREIGRDLPNVIDQKDLTTDRHACFLKTMFALNIVLPVIYSFILVAFLLGSYRTCFDFNAF